MKIKDYEKIRAVMELLKDNIVIDNIEIGDYSETMVVKLEFKKEK